MKKLILSLILFTSFSAFCMEQDAKQSTAKAPATISVFVRMDDEPEYMKIDNIEYDSTMIHLKNKLKLRAGLPLARQSLHAISPKWFGLSFDLSKPLENDAKIVDQQTDKFKLELTRSAKDWD